MQILQGSSANTGCHNVPATGGVIRMKIRLFVLKFSCHWQLLHSQKIVAGLDLLTFRECYQTQIKSRGLQESFLEEIMPELSLEERARITPLKKDREMRQEQPPAKTWRKKQYIVCWGHLGSQAAW